VEVDGSTLAADVSANIQQVSLVSKPDTLDTFSLTLVNEYPAMRWTHDPKDSGLFQVGSAVKIALGYVDALTYEFEGEITQLSPTFPESGTPTIAVEGRTRLHWLQGDKRTRTYQNMTDKQIVEKIAQDAGLQPQAEDPGTQYDYVMQCNQTDLEFIKQRAARIHYEVLVRDKTLIFRKSKESDPKTYTFVWGPLKAHGPDTLPLKSFNPVLNTSNQPTQVTVRGYDPKSKAAIEGKAGVGDEQTTMGSQTGAEMVSRAFRSREYVRVNIPVATQSEADEHAKAIYNDRAMEFLTGNGSTIGAPDLRSGQAVELEGLGFFSGMYYVDSATHTLSGSGYVTDFTVKRNARS
jgi:phage protein D